LYRKERKIKIIIIIIKRQATRHDCLPIWLGDGEKRIAIVYGKEKNVLLGRQEQPRKDKNLLYWLDKPEGPTKEGPLSFVLLESPFVSFSGPPLSSISG
jgi:hypothetical protein